MDSQMQIAVLGAASGLVGALIGAGATMLGARIQWQGARRERDQDRLDGAVTECAFAALTMSMELGYKTPKQTTTSLQSLLHSAAIMIVRSARESPHLSSVTNELTLKLSQHLRKIPENRVDSTAATLANALSACLHTWILDPEAFERLKQPAEAFIASVEAAGTPHR